MRRALGLAMLLGCGTPAVVTSDAPGDGRGGDGGGSGVISFIAELAARHGDATHSSISVTIGAQDPGDSTIAVVSWATPSASVASLADTSSNVYAMVDEVTDGATIQQVYVAPVAGASTTTITATFTANAQNCELRVLEYRGLASSPIDGHAEAMGSGTALSAGPITTTHADDLLLGAFTGMVSTAGSDFTQRIAFSGDLVEDRGVSAAGAYTATASGIAAPWLGAIIAFKAN